MPLGISAKCPTMSSLHVSFKTPIHVLVAHVCVLCFLFAYIFIALYSNVSQPYWFLPSRHAKKVFALSQGLIVPLHVNIAYNDLKYGKFIKIFHHLSTNSTHSFALRCSLPFNLLGLSHCLQDIMLPCMLQAHISTGCHTPPFVNMEGSYIC